MSARIAELLTQLEAAKVELHDAATILQADNARAEIATLTHSLWLAGYEFEDAA